MGQIRTRLDAGVLNTVDDHLAQRNRGAVQKRLRILVSAYACEPDKGSEPGVGWNWVCQIARRSDAWVITRVNHRPSIEAALAKEPLWKPRFIYFDLPRWARFWKRQRRGLYPYYYLWQIGAYLVGRRLHQQIGFDIVHHVTFVTYWMPSFLALLPVPFVWGPVGGGESAPGSFRRWFSQRGRIYELLRTAAQALGRLDPFVRLTARRAALALATTSETADRLRELGSRRIEVCSAMGLTNDEIQWLGRLEQRSNQPFRLLSIGNLLHLKGFELGLRSFAELARECSSAEYWLIGQGPEQLRLENLARELKVADQVKFWGELPRKEVLEKLAQCDVLVHPSLHDSGGCVCSEAMAAGRPVICLDLGGPALQVVADTGFKIAAISPEQVVRDLADALRRLANEPSLRARMGEAARRRVSESLSWDAKGKRLMRMYSEITAAARSAAVIG